MIYDLKRGLRLLAYSFQFGANTAIAVVTELVGILIMGLILYFGVDSPETYSSNPLFFVSGVMLLQLAPLMLAQMTISLECSGIILSSRFHKTVGVSLPGFICLVDAVQTLFFLVLLALVCRNTKVLGCLIFVAGIIFMIVLVYMTLAFRYLIVGIAIYIIGYVGVTFLASYAFYDITQDTLMTGKSGAALGILAMAAGLVLSSVMRKHLYKKPISKNSVSKKLRQYL